MCLYTKCVQNRTSTKIGTSKLFTCSFCSLYQSSLEAERPLGRRRLITSILLGIFFASLPPIFIAFFFNSQLLKFIKYSIASDG